ncbi:sensor histidine kinase [Phytoactinopolyspora limicola]|uniref:sensor histidine kinase n=1 Tax=Phytoactinopolyspora limicola TaxID=2715536 RepID=UPI001A9C7E45|nr:HAMP domain-containing sensor histidine kinase [Phytoactinopolyspora limicola]
MRISLPVRLLGLSLAVAACAITATAWLTTRDTGERFRGEFERTLEADTFIYQDLVKYAASNDSWDDVGYLLRDLAGLTGRRVALTDLDGQILADSAGDGGGVPPLPSNPTAEIDVLRNNVDVAFSGGMPYLSDISVFDMADAEDVEVNYDRVDPVDPAEAAALDERISFSVETASGTGFGGISPLWRMTDAEHEAREAVLVEVQSCLQDSLGVTGQLVVDQFGEILLLDGSFEVAAGTAIGSTDSFAFDETGVELSGSAAGDECFGDALSTPSQAARDLAERQAALMSWCLDDVDVPHRVVEGSWGLSQVVPAASPPESPRPDDEFGTWISCDSTAWENALEGYVAGPALLYTGSTERFDPFFGDGWWRTMLAGLAVLAAATGVTVLAGRRLTRPIHALTGAARRMGSGDHGARVRVSGRGELAELGTAFNSMAESVQTNEERRKAMVSDVAHELRTPLSNVRGYLEAAEDGVVPLDPALVSSLLEESHLLQRLIDDLQDLALADAGKLRVHPEDVDIEQLARQVVAAHGKAAADAEVDVRVDAVPVVATADPQRLRQAMGNLVANAVRFTPAGGHVVVKVHPGVAADAVVIEVTDDGPGIPPGHLPRLFDRFYRVEQSRSRQTGGSGLGLAITKHLVEAHEGTIEVASTAGEGSTFTIRLPAHTTPPSP